MKKKQKRNFKKKLKYFIWTSIIFIFLIIFNKKIVETRTINKDSNDAKAARIAQNTDLKSHFSYINEKDQSLSSLLPWIDIYEEDDQPCQAWPIVVNNPPHLHTFHNNSDIDWVYFFGHAEYQYSISADDGTPCDRFIKLSLSDPNGKILTTEEGVPIQSPFCSLQWQCQKDGYYCLKVESPSECPAEGISYKLSIKDDQAALPASVLGRVVNSKHEGLNGLRVNLISSGQINRTTLTGSLQNIRSSNLDLSRINGWYFIPGVASGEYNLILSEDDPNIILKEGPLVQLKPLQINKIEDILIDHSDREADALSSFDIVYTKYQNEKGKDYPVWEDKDGDGATNLDEFLRGTNPDDPNSTTRDIYFPGGWSMISIPLISVSTSVFKLFPDAVVIYGYEKGLGYKRVQNTEELERGEGYWILLKEGKKYNLTGWPVRSYTLSVNEDGWRMVGGCISAAQALADGCNIDVIYGYKQGFGYERIYDLKNLEPGNGYWIRLVNTVDQCKLKVQAD